MSLDSQSCKTTEVNLEELQKYTVLIRTNVQSQLSVSEFLAERSIDLISSKKQEQQVLNWIKSEAIKKEPGQISNIKRSIKFIYGKDILESEEEYTDNVELQQTLENTQNIDFDKLKQNSPQINNRIDFSTLKGPADRLYDLAKK